MNKYEVTQNYTIKEVMEMFEDNKDRVVFVVNSIGKIIGSVSQGDIVKALASGSTIFANVENIMNTSFIYLTSRDMKKAHEIIKATKITLIPIINKDGKLDSVINLEDIFKYLEDVN